MINQLHRHLRLIHKLDDHRSTFKCVEVGCYQRCSNWSSYRRHLNKFHYVFIDNTINTSVENENVYERSSNVLFSVNEFNNFKCKNDNFFLCIDDSTQEISSNNKSILNKNFLEDQIKNCASMLIAKLYSKPRRSRKMIQEYVEDITDLLSTSVSQLSVDISTILQNQIVNSNIIDDICYKPYVLKNPFKDLNSEYLRLQFFFKSGFYIAPEDYKIAHDVFK